MSAPEPIWRGSTELQEQVDSPDWNFTTDNVTLVRKWRGPMGVCLNAIPPMGAFLLGPYLGLRIAAASAKQVEKGGIGELTVRAEGLLKKPDAPDEPSEQPLPPDSCDIVWAQQEYALEKHIRYASIDATVMRAVQSFVRGANENDREEHRAVVEEFAGPGEFPIAAELAEKLARGQDKYVLYIPVYVWVQNFLAEPTGDAGGRPETPYGPLTVPTGIEWLRRGDEVHFADNIWKLVRSWQGSPQVDHDIYPVRALLD